MSNTQEETEFIMSEFQKVKDDLRSISAYLKSKDLGISEINQLVEYCDNFDEYSNTFGIMPSPLQDHQHLKNNRGEVLIMSEECGVIIERFGDIQNLLRSCKSALVIYNLANGNKEILENCIKYHNINHNSLFLKILSSNNLVSVELKTLLLSLNFFYKELGVVLFLIEGDYLCFCPERINLGVFIIDIKEYLLNVNTEFTETGETCEQKSTT